MSVGPTLFGYFLELRQRVTCLSIGRSAKGVVNDDGFLTRDEELTIEFEDGTLEKQDEEAAKVAREAERQATSFPAEN